LSSVYNTIIKNTMAEVVEVAEVAEVADVAETKSKQYKD